MKSKLVIFIVSIILFAKPIAGQESGFSVNLQGIFSLPNSEFGTLSDINAKITKRNGIRIGEKIGLAEKGFGLGCELAMPVLFDGMNWVFSAKILINGTSDDLTQTKINSSSFRGPYKSYWQPDSLGNQDTVVTLDIGTWINIPLMTGFRYNLQISNDFSLYGIAEVGIDFTKAPSLKASVALPSAAADTTIEEIKYDLEEAFGVDVGIGLIFNNQYNLGFRYINFGTVRYNGTMKVNRNYLPTVYFDESKITGDEKRISMFLITLGLIL